MYGDKAPARLIPKKDRWFAYNAHKLAKNLLQEGNEIDIVDAADYLGGAHYFLEDEQWPTPIVVTCHTPSFLADQMNTKPGKNMKERLRHKLEMESIKDADALVAPSIRLATLLSTQTGRPQIDFRQIHYPYPLNNELQLEVKETDVSFPFVLFSGRLERRKGVQTLLKAWAESEYKDTYQLVLAGEKTNHTEFYLKEIERLGLQKIKLIGHQDRSHLYWLYRNATLVVLPSEPFDNFPYTCIESLAMSAPTLVSSSGGMSEMINDGESGWIFEAGNPQSLTQNMDMILGLPHNERFECAKAGQDYIRSNLNPDKTTARYVKMYRHLISQIKP